MRFHIITQSLIDARLIAFTIRCLAFEKFDNIRIKTKRQLLLDRTIERSAQGPAPVILFRNIACIDLVIRQRAKFGKLDRLLRR